MISTLLALGGSLLGKIPLRVWLGVAGAAAVSVLIYLGISHYGNLLSERDTLRQNVATLNVALDEQKKATGAAIAAAAAERQMAGRYAEAVQAYAEAQRGASEEFRRLSDVFSRHDLGRLATVAPTPVQNRVQRASDRARRLLECATGAVGADCPAGPAVATGAAASTP